MLIVGSATGTPEHLLAADPSTSNLSTSKTLERPSELQYLNRQRLWADILHFICQYLLDQSVRAHKGILDGNIEKNEYGEEQVILSGDVSRKVTVELPKVVEHDILEQIQALIDASTLKGQSLAGTIDLKSITRLLLRILKEENADYLLQKLFPDDEIIMQQAGTPAGNDEEPEKNLKVMSTSRLRNT